MILVARTVMLAAATLLLTAAAPKSIGWNNTVAQTAAGGHLIGNPDAAVKLVEYVSYTCSDCASFMIQSDAALQIGYVSSGKLSIEVRHLVQGPVDLAAAMLANCGPPAKFALNHSALMRSQNRWRVTFERARTAQKQRWTAGALLSRGRAIADDMGFYAVMASRGYDRSAVDGLIMPAASMRAVSAHIASLDMAGRAAVPCIGRERADLVVAGCAILEEILDIWPAQQLGIADRGIREGILRGLMANRR